MDGDLVRGLRSRGIDVVTAADSGMIRRKDEEHLLWATVQGRALYSFNVGDYHEIHTEWIATGRNHAGIILAQQKRYSTGEQIRRLLRLIGSLTCEAMRNREEFWADGDPPWARSVVFLLASCNSVTPVRCVSSLQVARPTVGEKHRPNGQAPIRVEHAGL